MCSIMPLLQSATVTASAGCEVPPCAGVLASLVGKAEHYSTRRHDEEIQCLLHQGVQKEAPVEPLVAMRPGLPHQKHVEREREKATNFDALQTGC